MVAQCATAPGSRRYRLDGEGMEIGADGFALDGSRWEGAAGRALANGVQWVSAVLGSSKERRSGVGEGGREERSSPGAAALSMAWRREHRRTFVVLHGVGISF